MPFIQLKHARYYYEQDGEGEDTLVFGHSLLFNLRMFDSQVEYLKDSFRCIRFDFRGQGKTEVTGSGYDLDTLTEDVAELIDLLDCKPCHFIGFSMGGMVAQRLAIKYPSLVKSLVLIDTSSDPEPKETMGRNRLLAWVARYIGLRPVVNKVLSMFFGQSFLNDPNRKKLVSEWKGHFLSNDRVGVSKAVKGVLDRKRITEDLHNIQVKSLIMVGENDILTPLEKSVIMKNSIKGSELKIIPRAGHMSPVEEPEFVNDAIGQFLGK